MKIFIPFTIRGTGGTVTFARKFKDGLEKHGHEVFFDFRKDYDILFVIVQCNPLYLLHAKLNKRKIVHRLDGVYYWSSVAKWKYPLLNFAPSLIHNFFSNFTVYQSQYSKYCADKFLGRRRDEKFSIIYNGVDLNIFSPKGEKIEGLRDNSEQKIFFTVSKFRRSDQIIPLIKALDVYRKKYDSNFKFIIAGDFNGRVRNIPNKYKEFTYLHFFGKMNHADVPDYERSADVFLMTHLNPPCPNNVLEAMACGLPICGVNDGAMSEITAPGENSLLIKTEGDAFWKQRTYDYEQFADNLNFITKDLDFYAKNSRKIVEEKFSLDDMIANYLKFF